MIATQTFFYKRYALIVALLFSFFNLKAQNIVGDTIKVSESAFPVVMFPDAIKDGGVTFTCNKEDYLTQIENNRIKFKANVEKPASPCSIIIDEGNRSHQFTIVFVSGPVDVIVHNFSTMDLLKERVDLLNAQRKRLRAAQNVQVAQTAPAEAPAGAGSAMAGGDPENIPPPAEALLPSAGGSDGTIQVSGLTIRRPEFEKKVTDKLNLLSKDMGILADKASNTQQERMKTVDNAMNLFNNDTTRKVQVKNKSGIAVRPVKTYFKLLAQLKMEKPEVRIKSIQFISDLKLMPDGKYKGYATFIQEFTGIRGDKQMYRDVTEKSVEVILTVWDEIKDGVEVKKWDVYLGNISVQDTPQK